MPRYKRLCDMPPGMQELLERQAPQPAPNVRRNKYGNIRTEYNGELFDSKAEAEDDQALRLLETAGQIAGYARQVSIPLRGRKRGNRGVRMQLDFLVNEPRAHRCSHCNHEDMVLRLVLKDSKRGITTREWETKRRLLEAQLGLEIEVLDLQHPR